MILGLQIRRLKFLSLPSLSADGGAARKESVKISKIGLEFSESRHWTKIEIEKDLKLAETT